MNNMLIFGLIMLAFGLLLKYIARRVQKAYENTKKAYYDLKKELGRNPTNEEVQERLGLPVATKTKKEPCPPHNWSTDQEGTFVCTKCGVKPDYTARS